MRRRNPTCALVAAACGAIALQFLAAGAGAQNHSGIPVAAFTWIPIAPWYTDPVTFDASESRDAGGEIVRYTWDFGDGKSAEGQIVEHRYKQQGNYTITLTVVDNDGLTHSTNTDIPITDTSR